MAKFAIPSFESQRDSIQQTFNKIRYKYDINMSTALLRPLEGAKIVIEFPRFEKKEWLVFVDYIVSIRKFY